MDKRTMFYWGKLFLEGIKKGEDYVSLSKVITINIEVPKFKRLHNKDVKGNSLHRWLQFFNKDLPEDELKELIEMDTAIKRAKATLDYLSHDKKEYALYQARENALHERANMISTAKAEGREEGKFEVAKNMYISGMEIEKISQFTGIKVEELKKELEKERVE
jgi:predicted transposase/invertase (TIGR01784 family)